MNPGTFLKFIILPLLVTTVFLCPYTSRAQADTIFWFVAPDLYQGHGDRPAYLRLSTFKNAATITISEPANPSFTPISVSLNAYSNNSVDLTFVLDQVENFPSNTVNNKGLLIQSTALISAYYDVAHAQNGDMFSLKGKNALGTHFTVPFQNTWINRFIPSSIEVVATSDNTLVTITPTRDVKGHAAGIPFSIRLNRGQTYSCEAADTTANGHMPGTIVSSDKPIAITTKDDSVFPNWGTCYDTLGDQLVPDQKAGSEFIVIRGYLAQPDEVYVTAISDSTHVVIDGTEVAVLKAGEFYRESLAATTAYITTSKPCQLFHVTGFGCETGGAVIPTFRCTGSTHVTIVRPGAEFLSINVLAPTTIINGFTFNGLPGIISASDFQPVPGTGGAWSYARIPLSTTTFPVNTSANILNNLGGFQLGMIHGGEYSTCRYAYFSDFGNSDLALSISPGQYCEGGTIRLQANSTTTNTFQWWGPGGFSSLAAGITLDHLSAAHSGYYIVKTIGGVCESIKDSVLVNVWEKKEESVNILLCSGVPYKLSSGTAVMADGKYIDTLHCMNGCDSIIRTIQLSHRYLRMQNKTDTLYPCNIYPLPWGPLVSIAGNYADTLRYADGCDSVINAVKLLPGVPLVSINASICANESYALPNGVAVNKTGVYRDTLHCLSGRDTLMHEVNLDVKPLPAITVTKSSDINCLYSTATLHASGGSSYIWSPAASLSNSTSSDPIATPSVTTDYLITATSPDGCIATQSIKVVVSPADPDKAYFVASAFTPNGDGKNDRFGVPYWTGVTDFKMVIFNRWGQKVFETYDVGATWDGNNGGKEQGTSVYIYLVTAVTPCKTITRKGTVTLIR
jgi:gliding motility-associated-like protein